MTFKKNKYLFFGTLYTAIFASVTFIAILMTILIQATTTKWLARKLGLLLEE